MLLFSNVFISCCAVAQGGLTYLLLGWPFDFRILTMLGCATLALYNFSMILARPAKPAESPFRRVRWIFRHERQLWLFTLIAGIVVILMLIQLHRESVFICLLVGILGLAYNVPFIPLKNEKPVGLRHIPGIKLFYIALVWVLSCVFVPVGEAYHAGIIISWTQVLQLAAWMFLFIVGITIPFDIRDVYQDRHYGLKTIPIMIGERNTYLLCLMLLLIQAVWVGVSGYPIEIRIALISVTLVTTGLVFMPVVRRSTGEYYYFLLLDGMMILQFLAVYGVILLDGFR